MTVVAPGCNIGDRNHKDSTVWQSVKDMRDCVVRYNAGSGDGDKAAFDMCQQVGAKALPILFDTSAGAVDKVASLVHDHAASSKLILLRNESYGTWTEGKSGQDYYNECRPAMIEAGKQGIACTLQTVVTGKSDSIPDGTNFTQHLWDAAAAKGDDIEKLCVALDVHPYTSGVDPNSTSMPGFKAQLQYLNKFLDGKGSKMGLVLTEYGLAAKGSGPNTVEKIVGAGASTAAKEAAVQAYFRKIIALLEDPVLSARVLCATMYMANDGGQPGSSSQEQYFGRIAGYNATDRKRPHWQDLHDWTLRARAAGATGVLVGGVPAPTPDPTPDPSPGPSPKPSNGGDWRQLIDAKGKTADYAGDLFQGCTVARVADGSDGRKALTWTNQAGHEVARLRMTDDQWKAIPGLLGL